MAKRYISKFADWTPAEPTRSTSSNDGGGTSGLPAAQAAIIKGDKDGIVELVEVELNGGMSAMDIVNDLLIPGILTVGEKYEKKEYFLPQLLQSAETMQVAFKRLKPLLEADENAVDKPVVVMATVEGDIHDIGKNIVCLMLKNYGFDVVDLGKDVKAEVIVESAAENNAALIGLSALMTTTMVRMEDTVKLVRERGLDTKVIIGGAVVTEKFCTAIGADGWSTDAVKAVKLAQSLTH